MYWMETVSNNGIATPSGVAVGMNASILDKYGEVYYKEKKRKHNILCLLGYRKNSFSIWCGKW